MASAIGAIYEHNALIFRAQPSTVNDVGLMAFRTNVTTHTKCASQVSKDRAASTSREVRRGLRLRDRSAAELHPDLFGLDTSCRLIRARRIGVSLRDQLRMVGEALF